MKYLYSIPLSIGLLFLAGCEKKKVKPAVKPQKEAANKVACVDIPVAGDAVRNFFDDEVGEFAVQDDAKSDKQKAEESVVAKNDEVVPQDFEDEFAWVKDDTTKDYKVVYFDFDKYEVRADQEDVIAQNVDRLMHEVDAARKDGKEPLVVIEGHACSVTRSRVYNFALSERRAKILADRLVEAGVSRENLKIVGRGEEYPAIVNGKPVNGSKEEQWPNRRSEVHVIYA